MTQWDRKALLHLVDETGKNLNNPALTTAQRRALQAIVAHYGNKAKSIQTNSYDVLSMQNELAGIMGSADGEQKVRHTGLAAAPPLSYQGN